MKPLYRSRGVRPEKSGLVSHPRLRHSLFLVPVHMGAKRQQNSVALRILYRTYSSNDRDRHSHVIAT